MFGSEFNADVVPVAHLHIRGAPPIFAWFWSISTASTIVVLVLTVKHLSSLFLVGSNIKWQQKTVFHAPLAILYNKIFTFFPLTTLVSWAALFAPKFCLMFLMILRFYEVWCLLWFWELMVDLLNGPNDAFRILSRHQPYKVLNVPPLCCFPCLCQKRSFTKGDLIGSWWLTAQYGCFALLSILSVVISEDIRTAFTVLSAVSMLVCMYGLFILYKASHNESSEFHLTQKFVVIKVAVVLMKVLELVFKIPGIVEGIDDIYDEALMSMAWFNFVMNALSVPITIAAMLSFPSREVELRHVKHSDKPLETGKLRRGVSRAGSVTRLLEGDKFSEDHKPSSDVITSKSTSPSPTPSDTHLDAIPNSTRASSKENASPSSEEIMATCNVCIAESPKKTFHVCVIGSLSPSAHRMPDSQSETAELHSTSAF